jgi:hypothetical protein
MAQCARPSAPACHLRLDRLGRIGGHLRRQHTDFLCLRRQYTELLAPKARLRGSVPLGEAAARDHCSYVGV